MLASFSIFLVSLSSGKEEIKDAKPLTELSSSDCIKCHSQVAKTVDSKGGKHKTAVNCLDCHKGHPPMVAKEKIIPACSECHSGKPHFELPNCNSCHSDPHSPLDMKLGKDIKEPCLTCHSAQGKEMKQEPSKHANLACTICHTVHKEIPPCTRCHKPHTAEMTAKDCNGCHPAHRPLTVTYVLETPSNSCAACHQNIFNMLRAGSTKHASLECAYCHREKHKMIPQCEACHGSPHPPQMLVKFKTCNGCHKNAHDLAK